jgi:hypothetical protein
MHMTKPTARMLVAVPLGLAIFGLAGCAVENSSADVGHQQSALTEGTCPAANPVSYQHRVTAYVDYVLGAPTSPFTVNKCNGDLLGLKATTAKTVADILRTALDTGACTVGQAAKSTVCGVSAGERVITCLGLSERSSRSSRPLERTSTRAGEPARAASFIPRRTV